MAHSDTKVKINDDTEPPCYRPFQIANTSHSYSPRDTLKAGALPGFNPKYQTKRKTTFCLNNVMWFIYFTNYIITWQVANTVSLHNQKIFSQPILLQYTNILATCMCSLMRILLYDSCKLIYLAHTS